MRDLTNFLEKFKKIKDPKSHIRSVVHIIQSIINKNIDIKNTDLKDGVLYIKNDPYIKIEILMQKEKILDALTKEGLGVKDIK